MDTAFIIFAVTYLLLALGQPPIFRIDRVGAVIIGASLMVVLGILSVEEAYEAIDYKTILTLFGIMVLTAHLRLSGLLNIVLAIVAKRINSPKLLLYSVTFVSGLLSAFFINDTICLIFTPFILDLTKRLNLNPKPYLLCLCMSANIGSVATITGNPQNIIIGAASGIDYKTFFLKLFPVSVAGLLICGLIIELFYRRELKETVEGTWTPRFKVKRWLVVKSLIATILTLTFFFMGFPMEIVALGVATFLLITRRIKPEKVYNLIDFKLLILFVGLFIVIKGFEKSMLFGQIMEGASILASDSFSLILSSAVLSNVVSNVPAVLIFKPIIQSLRASHNVWLLLAMSSTLAGNLTILGSIANIIVVEGSAHRVRIGFLEYMKVGIPVTVLTLLLGALILVFL